MGFLSGRISYERFRVGGDPVALLGEQHLETLDRYAIGKAGAMAADGIEMGFTAGAHILDLDFRSERCIINDALHFGMRVDVNKVPSDLLRAYTQLELAALTAENPSGFPSKRQRAQAKEAALERCQAEAQTGKFRKTKHFPILWDTRQGIVYFGSSSTNAIERFVTLFKDAFGRALERVTSGTIAHAWAAEKGSTRALEDLSPSVFAGPARTIEVNWVANQFGSRDFLGNEMMLWLWWVLETQADAVRLSDESAVTCMMNKTLSLECPLAEHGKETISSEAPTKLPEAKRAVLGGKLPRKTGLILVRHDEQYELTLQAEALSVGSSSLPKLDSDPGRAETEDRIDQVRHLSETVDLLFEAFCRRRLSSTWNDDLAKIRIWLEKSD